MHFLVGRKLFIIAFFGLGIFLFFGVKSAQAADCGDTNSDGITDTVCSCGDTVIGTASYTYQLTGDLTCTGHGLLFGSNSITIDGGGHRITGDGDSSDWGINNDTGQDFIIIKDLILTNFYRGVSFTGGTTSTIQNITVERNIIGIYLTSNSYGNDLINNTICFNKYGVQLTSNSKRNNLTSNNIYSNSYGIDFTSSARFNTSTRNIILNNRFDVTDAASSNSYISNQFLHNATSTMLSFVDVTRTKSVNNSVNFDFSMFNLMDDSACSDCTYQITVNPSETVLSSKDGNQVTGSFTVTKPGTYTLTFSVTDTSSNFTKRNLLFLVGDTDTQITTYYLRGINPTHGQPIGSDNKSLLLTPSNDTEIWLCDVWVQNSPDEIPDYPLANLLSINTHSWYKQSSESSGYIGVERFVVYGKGVDSSSSIPAAADYTLINKNLTDLNWGMDSAQSWYWLTLKLNGTDPYWTTFPSAEYSSQPSYADFTYSYSINPAIKSLSNNNIILLSATTDSDSNASIVLENPAFSATTTSITLTSFNRPFNGLDTNITSASTTFFTTSNISTSTNLSLSSVNLSLTPSTGSVTTSITTWNTTGDYSKQWTETSTDDPTVTHIVGDFNPSTYYTVWYTKQGEDQAILDSYLADESGQITFTYDQGFSTVTFKVEEDTASPTAFSLVSPANNADIEVNRPTFTWEASQDSESGLAKYQLYIDNTLDTDNINANSTSTQGNTILTCGRHTWYMRAFDNNGNYTTTDTYNLTKVCTPNGGGGGAAIILPPVTQPSTPTQSVTTLTTTPTLPSSLLLKSPSSSAVFVITPQGYKYHLPNEQVFLSYGYTRDQITITTQLNAYPTSTLIKLPNNPKVYLIQNNHKHWIINESIFNALNLSWSAITTVNNPDFDSYPLGSDLTSPSGVVKAATTYQFTQDLTLGSQGPAVQQLQTILKTLGFFTYPYLTTYYGPITQQAVKDFQQAHHLTPSGSLDQQTREVVNNLY